MKHKNTKTKYRLRNGRDYNRALVERGSLTMWINDDAVRAWRNTESTGKREHPRTSLETVILTMATLQEIYPLPLRQIEGLLGSILTLLQVGLPGAGLFDPESAAGDGGGGVAPDAGQGSPAHRG